MALCGSYSCGCGLSVSSDFALTGSGQAGDPWAIAVATDPPALAKGVVGYAQITADQGSITTVVDITGLSVTWTAVAGRRYRIAAAGFIGSTATGEQCAVEITDASNVVQMVRQVPTSTAAAIGIHAEVIQTGLSGSITRKVRARRIVGTGTLTFQAGATYPGFILVEDIGT